MQTCLSVCKITHLLRAAGPSINREFLHEHDVQLERSLNDMLGCQLSSTSCDQATCSIRAGGLGLRRAIDLALPAFIASRIDSRTAVVSLIDELFCDGIGELLTTTFDDGVKNAVRDLKNRLSDAHAIEVGTCLSEARDRCTRNDLNIPVLKSDNLIAPAAFVDPDEDNTTQGSLSAIVDRDIVDKLLVVHVQNQSEPDVRMPRELNDSNTSHDWVSCINPMYGPVLERDLFLTATKIRLGASFFYDPFVCPKCRMKDMNNAMHALCCAKGESTKSQYRVCDCVLEVCHLADPSSETEIRNLFLDAPTFRLADHFTCVAFLGRMAALDIGICCPDANGAGLDCCDSMHTSKIDRY